MRNKKRILTIVAMLVIIMSFSACSKTDQFMSSDNEPILVDSSEDDSKNESKIKKPDKNKELTSDEISNSDSINSEAFENKDSKHNDKKEDTRSEEEIVKGVLRIRQWKAPNVKCMLPVKRNLFR